MTPPPDCRASESSPAGSVVDTHAHLCAADFACDLEAVLERARLAGVTSIISVSETLADAERNLALARSFPMILPAAGLYPAFLDWEQAQAVAALIRRQAPHLVAIGEVGLDYWVVQEETGRELQRCIFALFIALALELDLPLNVHSRSAGRHAIALLRELGARRVQLHAFDGRAASARAAVEAGFFFSIPPSVVRSPQKIKLVKALPLECLLVETDSPVLGPDPGARNEPAQTRVALEAMAGLKRYTLDETLEALARNTRRLYGDRLP